MLGKAPTSDVIEGAVDDSRVRVALPAKLDYQPVPNQYVLCDVFPLFGRTP